MKEKRYACLLRSQDGWASLIGFLIAAAIAVFLYAMYANYSQRVNPDMVEAQQALDPTVVDPQPQPGTGSIGVLHSATRQIQAIDERNRQRGDDLMKEIGAMQGN